MKESNEEKQQRAKVDSSKIELSKVERMLTVRGVNGKYASAHDFLDDAFDLIMIGNITGSMVIGLIKLLQKAKDSDIKIPFYELIRNESFDLYEIYILLRCVFHSFAEHKAAIASELIQECISHGLCSWNSVCATFISNKDKLSSLDLIGIRVEEDNKQQILYVFPTLKLLNAVACYMPALKKSTVEKDTQKNMTTEDKKYLDTLKPYKIYEYLNKYVIGQDRVKRNLSSAVYSHFLKCLLNAKTESDKLDKTNILLIGTTGTGKTFLCQTLANYLNIPFYAGDASQITASGYIGLSVEDLLLGLKNKIPDMQDDIFPPSIVFIDEIDKLAISKSVSHGTDIGCKKVQEELLKLVESNYYTISNTGAKNASKTYDISNILFIGGGAFSGLDTIVRTRLKLNGTKQIIGFMSEDAKKEDTSKTALPYINTEDLISYGFTPEFLGRFTNISILSDLTKQDLVDIIVKAKNNVISQYVKIWKAAGITLKFEKGIFDYIAETALKNKTGARGIRNIISNTLNVKFFEVLQHDKKSFVLRIEHLHP